MVNNATLLPLLLPLEISNSVSSLRCGTVPLFVVRNCAIAFYLIRNWLMLSFFQVTNLLFPSERTPLLWITLL